MLRKQLRPAIVLTLVLCVITGLVYPGVVTGLAQLSFPRQANGSLVTVNGKVVGSALIGQPFSAPVVLPSAALGARARVRRHRVGRHQQGPDRPEARRHADRAGAWTAW